VIRHGGKRQFPFLRDPNTEVEMYESDDIVRYLFEHYGAGSIPWALGTPILSDATSMLASLPRMHRGRAYRLARQPEQPLDLWSFEASPFCRLVRETLCELEIPHHLHNVAKGSPKRDAFIERSGKMMVPYLDDPNTGTALFESAEICRYLEETYAR
jgi:glutathione S-transferase